MALLIANNVWIDLFDGNYPDGFLDKCFAMLSDEERQRLIDHCYPPSLPEKYREEADQIFQGFREIYHALRSIGDCMCPDVTPMMRAMGLADHLKPFENDSDDLLCGEFWVCPHQGWYEGIFMAWLRGDGQPEEIEAMAYDVINRAENFPADRIAYVVEGAKELANEYWKATHGDNN